MSDRAGTRDLRACASRLASCVVVAVACTTMRVESRGLAADEVAGGGWRAGVAVVRITPERPLPMAGYAGRKEPAEGTEQDLFAKALAIEDAAGGRVVLITLDLIGVSAELRSQVVAALGAARAIPAHAILLNASHTHCGPDYRHEAATAYRESLSRSIVAAAIRQLTEAGAQFAGVVLSQVGSRGALIYGYDSYSPYYGKYGEYYQD